MYSKIKTRGADYLIYSLNVFLIFCLLFEADIELPNLVAWLGHWHPLILHFPIVLLLMAIFLGFTRKHAPRLLLTIAVVSTLITAISGFFLGLENAVKGDLLFRHQWLGVGTGLIATLWYGLDRIKFKRSVSLIRGLQLSLIVLIGFTGHYGGMITHGEDFLAIPTNKKYKEIPENPIIYTHIVKPILDDKCIACHNPDKLKGELAMTSVSGLLKGGATGAAIVPGEPNKSEMIKRLLLPSEDKEHMPPKGKKPLNDHEIRILERWIFLGASDTLRQRHLKNTEPLAAMIEKIMSPKPKEKWTDLPKVTNTRLQSLGSNYITIKRIANNTDALSVNAYTSPEYDPQFIVNLKQIAGNIVELDLSGLSIGDKEMTLISQCTNLERLELDKTTITDTSVQKIAGLSKLNLLKIYDTDISDKVILVFKNLKSLKQLYIWGTSVSEKALEELKQMNPELLINKGTGQKLQTFVKSTDSIPKT